MEEGGGGRGSVGKVGGEEFVGGGGVLGRRGGHVEALVTVLGGKRFMGSGVEMDSMGFPLLGVGRICGFRGMIFRGP